MEIVIGFIVVIALLILITGKSRRATKLKTEIYELVRSGRESGIMPDVFFEAALKFALESGAELEPGQSKLDANSIHFRMNIDGTNYFIYFAKQPSGATFISVTDADKMAREFRKKIGGV